ncbi:MAG TPA: hypothetical protein P5330_08140, partial [Candidatus Competibacteraceae bacterium]|nr:hypothetical protein [Candidatus Competibacteraceae bacterium]
MNRPTRCGCSSFPPSPSASALARLPSLGGAGPTRTCPGHVAWLAFRAPARRSRGAGGHVRPALSER